MTTTTASNRFASMATAFPSYPIADLPQIPDAWIDASWKNDACPSFNTPNGLQVFVDFKDPSKREMPEISDRFFVCLCHDKFGSNDVIFTTDEWMGVIHFVARFMMLPTRLVQMVDGAAIVSEFTDANLFQAMEAREFVHTGWLLRPGVRPEIFWRPCFSTLSGPMWGGDHIRYETTDAYAHHSK
ncbi:MAG: hypothetical protein KDI55_00245 [Anaerolineae bacterium]|nr:hypothetical protein [Anaerolineae bacterium]